MDDLAAHIVEVLQAKPGLRAKDIAFQLGVDKQFVNSALHGSLRDRVRQDRAYRWHLRATTPIDANTSRSQPPQAQRSPLARLCQYYLDCLSHDDVGGVSVFASSKYGPPSYVELRSLPMLDSEGTGPFDSDAGRQLLASVRRDRNRQTLFIGYPVRLHLIRSRKSDWQGFKIEPLLLFPLDERNGGSGMPTPSDDLPQINLQALRSLTNAGNTNPIEEAIQLADELGLNNVAGDQPDFDEILTRLRDIRSEWDWQEDVDPYEMSTGTALANINEEGIYNRAILVVADRSPYTKGLESELGMLQAVDESKCRDTALGSWMAAQTIESPPADQATLLEVLPLNSEQRQAVRQALSNPLTVITGPPGTGKSQVVTSILVNAAWQGQTVLFASKNNKAVDVVEARVNALGPRPLLLRLGANEYQARLADYLVSLLAAAATQEDDDRYREHLAVHNELRQRADKLDSALRSVVSLRNEVDNLERRAENIRHALGEAGFAQARHVNQAKLADVAEALFQAIDQADRDRQGLAARLLWVFVRGTRFARLKAAVDPLRKAAQQLQMPLPMAHADATTIDDWVRYRQRFAERVAQVNEARAYHARLALLTQGPTVEDLSRACRDLTRDISANSHALWQGWLRLQPSRLTSQQRRLLGDYCALLQMIVGANEQSHQLGRDVYRRYYQLFPHVTPILSCWAVTSLSARGRVPFEPRFFDLLVVDEASQCDIASALPLLYRARRVAVIGDPMQLRHISTLSKQQDQQLLSRHGLLEPYAGWAYGTRSLFDLAASLCRGEDIVALRDHHRSHADIIEFSNEAFYEGRLRVATRYDRLRRPWDDGPAVRWVDVKGRATRPPTGGAVNEAEARQVVTEILHLLHQGYRGSIGVVSPFRAQANRIRDLMFQQSDLAGSLAHADFLSDVVHSFQGDQRDVIYFSPAISSDTPRGALWFLNHFPNLFNVAITRACAALVVVGDRSAAMSCGVKHLSRYAAYIDGLGGTQQTAGYDLRTDFGPAYPAVAQPERVSEWEHVLYRAMYALGIRPIPQYVVEKYVLDFALVNDSRRLAIEVDGERYHRNWDGDLCRRDQIMNQRLMELGWDVMRFWVYQIRDDLEGCISRVRKWIEGAK